MMTDSLHVEEEEQRLRERLKAKSQKRRVETSSNSPPSRDRNPEPRRSLSPVGRPPHHHVDARRGGEDYHRGGGGRGDRYPPYDDRDRRRPYRDGGWRGQQREDPYGRGPPPPNHRNYNKHDAYYPPPARGGGGRVDPYGQDHPPAGREPSPPPPRHRRRGSRSASRSRSRSYSHSSRDDDMSSRSGGSHGGGRHRARSSRHSRSRSRSRSYSHSDSGSVSDSSRSSVESKPEENKAAGDDTNMMYTKDQRTVFVTQLVQRTVERDIKKYFSKNNLKVNEVILLRDKRTGRHKGCAYVELRKIEDITKALALSNVAPTFQRFPILIKASEAEKNYVAAVPAVAALTAAQMGKKVAGPPLIQNGKLLEAQKVYVGSLDPSVTQEHLFVLYSQFGQLEKVSLQVDQNTGLSKGFAFLSFRDPKEANLAIQTMGNQVLAGRPMKTGWAVNQIASIPGAEVVTSNEFPLDASIRATNAYKVLAQLTMGVPVYQIGQTAPVPNAFAMTGGGVSRVPTVAEARATLAAAGAPLVVPMIAATTAPIFAAASAGQVSQLAQPALSVPEQDPSKVGNAENPTCHILVHNMFDKDQETEPGWEVEIKEEFEEECSKFGKIMNMKVMSKEIGGKIYASFDTTQGAQNCASSLAGRWFDKRRLRVEFVQGGDVPN